MNSTRSAFNRTVSAGVFVVTHRLERLAAVEEALAPLQPRPLLAHATTAAEAVRMAMSHPWRLALLDADGLRDNWVGLVHHMARWCPGTEVLVLHDPVALPPGRLTWTALAGPLRRHFPHLP